MADDPQIGDVSAPDLAGLATANADALSKALGISKDLPGVVNAYVKWVLYSLQIVLRAATRLVSYAVSIIQKVFETDNPEIGRLAVHVIGTLFGTELKDTITSGIFTNAGIDQVSEQVGHGVLEAIFGPSIDDASGDLTPSTVGAERFLGSITNLVTRGFLVGAVVEAFSVGQVKLIHELEEDLIAGLGLGRMARQAIRPFVQTLITTPAEWQVHKAYRPTLLPVDAAIRTWLTGDLSAEQLDDELGRQGYSSDRIDALVNLHTKQDDEATMHTLILHDVASEDQLKTALVMSGMQLATAEKRVQAWRLSRQDVWLQKTADVILGRFIEGLVDTPILHNDLRLIGVPDDVTDAMIQYAEIARELPRKILSEADAKDAWTKAVITQDEYRAVLKRHGYSDDDVTTKILLGLTNIRDKEEAAQAKKQVQADHAAAQAAAKQQKAADDAAKKAAAAAERQQKAVALAAHKQKIAADQLALKQFIAAAARQKQALVDAQHQQQLITDDAVTLARAQIAADEQALLASVTGQEAAAKASYERQLLELRQADREATVAQQLADVDLALETDRATRSQLVATRVAGVDQVLAHKLANLDDIYTARAQSIDADLAAALDALHAAALPSEAERRAAVAHKIDELDAELARRLSDTHAEYAERQAAVDSNLADGLIKPNAAALEHNRLRVSEDTAIRLAQQQHDISVARLQAVGDQAEALAVHEADKQQTALVNKAESARKTLAADKLKAQLAARQAADTEKIGLQTIASQIAPITEAEAARRRRQIQVAAAAAKRQETITETEIAKGEASAKAAIDKANAGVAAAKSRLAQVAAAGGARESAAQAAAAAVAALTAQLDTQRAELEAQLAADEAAAPSEGSPA